MREIQASEAKTHLPALLDEVERGETLVITRHGKPIARLVPEATIRQAEVADAVAQIRALRTQMPSMSADEIKGLINEGRRF
jgi:prevent-host-death family protein